MAEARPAETPREQDGEQSDLGAEIRKAMMERKKEEKAGGGGDLFNGVAEEVREIEWPSFGKVLGTTGVVLGVIAGSSVVLLTVNALLAELSDKVFVGRGVQDFFS
ncbi:Preprotein translocase subunit SECE1 [Linum grandiflorum]